eukprot:scaffold159670_cov32-Tisochrysis_lutea.AAC.1
MTTYVAPIRVSARVVKTRTGPGLAFDSTAKSISAPSERPIHARCIAMSVAERSDSEHPLAQRPPLNGKATALALAIDDLLVGEDGAKAGTPIDRLLVLVREPLLVQLQKDPLRPLDIANISGGELSIPVIREAERAELALEVCDVELGRVLWRQYIPPGALRGARRQKGRGTCRGRTSSPSPPAGPSRTCAALPRRPATWPRCQGHSRECPMGAPPPALWRGGTEPVGQHAGGEVPGGAPARQEGRAVPPPDAGSGSRP